MTVIVGLVQGGKVYVGGDSAGVAGYDLTVRADKKVFRSGDFVVGFCGSFRMGNILQHKFAPPRRHPDDDLHMYMVNDFVESLRKCLLKGGFAKKEDEVEEGGTFLVGYEGRLFKIEDDYQVGEGVDNFAACGCGESYALGSLYTSKGSPRARITKALESAERFSAGVRGPFHIEVA